MNTLNLLRYPSLAHEKKVFHRRWTGLAGLLVGIGFAWGLQHWQELETVRLESAHKRLQETVHTRQQQTQEVASQNKQNQKIVQQAAHFKRVVEHQQAWANLQVSLLQEARERGLRLQRLELEADDIQLHGTMNRLETMEQVRQSLSAQWPQPLSLQSMTFGPAEEVKFVWKTRWPQAQAVTPPASHNATGKP